MTPRILLPALLAGYLLGGLVGPLHAQPKLGVGIYVGTADYASETSFSGVPLTYDSDGTSTGLDLQIPLGDLLSANLFYLTSSEESDVFNELPLDTADVTNRMAGLQLRVWPVPGLFAGAHVASFRQSLDFKQFLDEDGSGTGYGVTAGAEVELSGRVLLIVAGQYDEVSSMDVLEGFDDTSMTGLRIHLGLRLVVGR